MLKTIAALALLAVSAGAQAEISINASKYFAYATLPARGTSVKTVIALSDQACEAKNAPVGSKKAAYIDRYQERAGCWEILEDIVGICPATAERGVLGNACFSMQTRSFLDVKSLPTRARF